ncbi:hypothetical protein NC651_023559 [Populus alba x Populus x berolinensis]|nr:hypothetical protein NC651_023559 [Populus alba x Populus x berolinensis]
MNMGFLLTGLVTTLLERELPNREKPELGYDLWYCLPFARQDIGLLKSSASFFQDNSVPLGRLIGIRLGNGALNFPRRVHVDEGEKIGIRAIWAASSEVSGARRADMSHGICIPLLFGTLEKMRRSKSKSRQ